MPSNTLSACNMNFFLGISSKVSVVIKVVTLSCCFIMYIKHITLSFTYRSSVPRSTAKSKAAEYFRGADSVARTQDPFMRNYSNSKPLLKFVCTNVGNNVVCDYLLSAAGVI